MSLLDFDLRAYLQHLGVQFFEAGSPNVGRGWLGTRCLYCDDDHNHLGLSLTYKNFSCWKCKRTGSLLEFIQDLENVSYGLALRRLDEFQTLVPTAAEARPRLLHGGTSILPPDLLSELTDGQRDYLRRRRFDPDQLVADWSLLSGPISGPWRYRIIIPVYLRGEVVTWVGMDTTGVHPPKYLAAPVEQSYVPVSELVYGADHAGRHVLVVEGATDVWRMGRGAVALLGMGGTADKLRQLLALTAEKFYVMLDGEPTAIDRAHRLTYDLLAHGRQAEVVELSDGDPADLPQDQATALRHELMIGKA